MAGELELIFALFIGSVAMNAVLAVLLVIVSLFTPGWSYFKAKIRHQPLLDCRRRDKKIDLHRADAYIEGLAISKKYNAAFIIDPESVYQEKKSGVSVLPVNAEIGITLSDRIMRCIDGLKRMGFSNIEDAETANMLYGKCSCGYEGFMSPVFIKEKNDAGEVINEVFSGLRCPKESEDGKQEPAA